MRESVDEPMAQWPDEPLMPTEDGAYLTREQVGERLKETSDKIRRYCDVPGADEHFGAKRVHRGRVYPGSSLPKFREALMLTPKRFGEMLGKIASGEMVPVTPSPLVPTGRPVAITAQEFESVAQRLIGPISQLALSIPAPEDSLLTAPEVREILRGSIPRSLHPVAKDPARWSRQQVNRYIRDLLRQ